MFPSGFRERRGYRMTITAQVWELIVTILGIILTSSVLVALINKWFDRRKTTGEAEKLLSDAKKVEAEADSTIADSWEQFANRTLLRITALEQRLDIERKTVVELECQVQQLRKELGSRIVEDAQREAELLRLRSCNEAKDKEIQSLRARVHELENKLTELTSLVQKMSLDYQPSKEGTVE